MINESDTNLLTAVIPIYNSEDTLSRCIDSILRQTYGDMDILLIDDGSTDGSAAICDTYAKEDDRVRVIHRPNEGLVSARKLGARETRTEYIAFVDSDDWMEPEAFEVMMRPVLENRNTDLVITGMVMDKGSTKNIRHGAVKSGCYDKTEIADVSKRMMYLWDEGEFGILGSVCGKIYNRNLFGSVVDRIDNRITYGEDDALVYTLVPKCKRICILDDVFYHYCISPGTMGTSFSFESFEKLKILTDFFESVFKEYGIWTQQRDGVHQIVGMFLYLALSKVYGINVGHQFPFGRIPKDSEVVLYGAGAVGKDYYHAIRGSGYAKIVDWLDSYPENPIKDGWDVGSIERIDELKYDMVIICVEAKEIAEEIRQMLITRGVNNDKIFWETPRFLYT